MVDKFRSIWYHSFAFKKCGCSSVVELQPSKLAARVRFPSPAPNKNPFGFFFSAFRSGTSVRNWSSFRLRAKFSLSLRNLPSLPSSLFGRRLARFPSPAPFLTGFPLFFYFGLGNLCSNLAAFSLARKILPFSQKLAFASFLPIRSALGAFPFTRSKQEPFRVLFFCFSFGNLCSNLVAFSYFF